MYIILNSKLERIGTLSDANANGTPFYGDQITQQIADDDQEFSIQSVPDTTNYSDPNGNTKNWGHTLDQINVPYGYPDTDKIAEGNSLAYEDPNNHRWYIMRLTSVMDVTDQSGHHVKQATGINLCVWKLSKTVPYARTLQNCNSTRAFRNLLDDTGWYMNPNSEPVGGSSTIQFDGTSSAQSLLQQLCQTYGAEIDAYVEFPKDYKMPNGDVYSSDFQVAVKRVDVSRHLGTDNGDRIVYGRNATNIQRTIVDDNLYTRLYVYGPNGSTCSCSLTNNEPYVQDENANQIYNPATGDNAENYLEGAITSQTMTNPQQLALWGFQQLKIFNHPRANYTVTTTSQLNDERGNRIIMNANIGDTFRVLDEEMTPKLTVEARVIRKTLSFSDPSVNSITLGEFTTVNVVTPTFIKNLQNQETNHINDIINEIKQNPNALTCVIDKPDGTTWRYKEPQKRFISHIYVMGDDITNLIQPQGFIWQLWQNGQINNDFTNAHQNDGQTLVLHNDIHLDSNLTSQVNSAAAQNSNVDSTFSSMSSMYAQSTSNINTNNMNSSSSDNNFIDNNSGYFNDNGISPEVQKEINSLETPPSEVSANSGTVEFDDGNGLGASKPMLGETKPQMNLTDENTDSGDSFNLNGYDINEYLDSPESVTGEVRLLIDTDYIGTTQGVNFNTDRIQHVFTVGDWTNHWGDNRIGAIQYINYNPNDKLYYTSEVYYGKNRPRNSKGSLIERTAHTEFARLDGNGNYVDSMIVLFSHHNSNFGLDYTTSDTPYIWTTIQDYYSPKSEYDLVRIPYQPNTVVKLSDIPQQNRLKQYGEPSVMTYYDNSSDDVILSHDYWLTNPSHPVDFYHAQDLLQNHNSAKPFTSIRLTDYGFVPKSQDYTNFEAQDGESQGLEDYSSQQTFQSGCLHYPYYFFDSGDVNMSDQRMVYCIDIQSGNLVFAQSVDLNQFNLSQPNDVIGDKPGNFEFAEPETMNWTTDNKGQLCFLYGLNVGYNNIRTKDGNFDENGLPQPDYVHFEQLYKVGYDINSKQFENSDTNPNDDSENGHPKI